MTRSDIRPSSAQRLRACPASILMEADCPDDSNRYATRGTATHQLAAECLLYNLEPSQFIGRCLVEGNDNIVDEEMVEQVMYYISHVDSETKGGVGLIEQSLDFSNLIGIPGTFGTADAVIIHSETDSSPAKVTIIDLKTGYERVSAKDNDQLLCYAAGVIDTFGPYQRIESFKLTIVQPSLGHIDSVEVTPDEVLAYVGTLRDAANRAFAIKKMGATAEDFNPGEKQCRYCKAKASCPALESRVLTTVADSAITASKSITQQLEGAIERVKNSDNAHVADCYSALPLVKAWAQAVETRAYQELESGNELPGYKLVRGNRGIRRWSDERLVAEALGALSDDVVFQKRLNTPKQIENMVNTGEVPLHLWQAIEPLIYQQRNKNQIAPINDKRPALKTVAFAAQQHPNPTDME